MTEIKPGYVDYTKNAIRKANMPKPRAANASKLLTITFQLSLVHANMLRKPVNGQGGWQDFLRKLQNKLQDDNRLVLDYSEIRKIYRYTYTYGVGGFEQRLEGILLSIKEATDTAVKKTK